MQSRSKSELPVGEEEELGGEGRGFKRERSLIHFLPLKREGGGGVGLLEREGLIEHL